MQRRVRKLLHDVLEACDALDEFTEGRSRSDYESDRLLRAAVERELMILGEALYQARPLQPDLEERITDLRGIIAFRHVLVHGYGSLEHDTVWGIVTTEVPLVGAEVQQLLDEA